MKLNTEQNILSGVCGASIGAFLMFVIFICIPARHVIDKKFLGFKAGDIVEITDRSMVDGSTDFIVAPQVYKIEDGELEVVLFTCANNGWDEVMYCPPDQLKIVAHVDISCIPGGDGHE